MVFTFKVFKKGSNGEITMYLGKRDFVDNVDSVEPIDGIILLERQLLENQKVYVQLICSFRYGREEDEVMGLKFQKELHLASEQIYPPLKAIERMTKLQERLMKKLGKNSYPFTLILPPTSPTSVILQPGSDDDGQPCGIEYYLKAFIGENEYDRSYKRSIVTLGIRKIQFAPLKQGRQPCTLVRKDFMLSPGDLELEATLDKQLYYHGEKISVNISIRNYSNKTVRKVKGVVQQLIDVCIFANGQYKATVASIETQEGFPINPGSSLQKVMYLIPTLSKNKERRGVALDGQLKKEDTNLASSTLIENREKDAFGILVSYRVKIKLYLGAIGGELVAELPFILMHPRPDANLLVRESSQAEVEIFRQDTIDYDGPILSPMEETLTEKIAKLEF